MKGYRINGIQQLGVGVSDVKEAWNWYNIHFGMDCRILEDDSVAKLMLPYTGGLPQKRHAVIAVNLQSGGGFEIWQYKGRKPLKINEPIKIGDIGVICGKIKVKNIDSAYSFFKMKHTDIICEPVQDPSGKKTFFVRDPYGNIFQLTEDTTWFVNENKETGGAFGAIIGVSDIERAKVVYSDILGYSEVIYDKTGVFSDLANIPGGDKECHRVLLKSEKAVGPFSKLFGPSMIELVCTTGKPGKNIFENRFWGDLGFIHLCFDIKGMDEIQAYCLERGFPFTVDSRKGHEGGSFDMGEAAGHFSYIEDPDGTLIEFVETHKVPILKKIGWYLDLRKRDPEKSLPDWILKTLRFSRVKAS